MSRDWVTELRNRVDAGEDSADVLAMMLNEMQESINAVRSRNSDMEDKFIYTERALRMIAQIQPTEEGARMAIGLAEEALSAVGT